jgi:hypothetical protein
VNDELERIWKEAVVAKVKVLSQHLPGGTEESHEKSPVTIVGFRAHNLTGNLQNTKQVC